jgi:hypothetical protein
MRAKKCSETRYGTTFQSICFDVVAKPSIIKSNIAYPQFFIYTQTGHCEENKSGDNLFNESIHVSFNRFF